jgi:hypothetical protein
MDRERTALRIDGIHLIKRQNPAFHGWFRIFGKFITMKKGNLTAVESLPPPWTGHPAPLARGGGEAHPSLAEKLDALIDRGVEGLHVNETF